MGGKTQISASSAPKKTGKGSRKPKAKAKKERLAADYIGKGKSADEWVSNSGLAIISGWGQKRPDLQRDCRKNRHNRSNFQDVEEKLC